MIRVLIVDDSAFMRNALTTLLSSDPEITVAGTARDGYEAVDMVEKLKPDVVTLDVEMPKMDGIAALRQIMKNAPLPVIMISSLTTEGAKLTLQSLELGAMDFIPKNLSDRSSNILNLKDLLISKIKAIAKGVNPARAAAAPVPERQKAADITATAGVPKGDIIVIGASTGGPRALQSIIPRLARNLPIPVLIAQHMPEGFTRAFADRLSQMSEIAVKEAESGESIKAGIVYIAPGSGHMAVEKSSGSAAKVVITTEGDHIYRPSVDTLFSSVADHYASKALGIILTGMGTDGLKGATKLKRLGGTLLAQDETSSAVFGMPRSVIDAGLAEKVITLDEVSQEIMRYAGVK